MTSYSPLSQADLRNAASKYGRGEVSITWTARAVVEGSQGPESRPSHLAFCTFTFDGARPACGRTLSYSQVTVDPGTAPDAGWNAGRALNTLQATQINGGTSLIDVTSAGQVQSWTVDIDDSTATATIAQANAADSSQLLQTGG